MFIKTKENGLLNLAHIMRIHQGGCEVIFELVEEVYVDGYATPGDAFEAYNALYVSIRHPEHKLDEGNIGDEFNTRRHYYLEGVCQTKAEYFVLKSLVGFQSSLGTGSPVIWDDKGEDFFACGEIKACFDMKITPSEIRDLQDLWRQCTDPGVCIAYRCDSTYGENDE